MLTAKETKLVQALSASSFNNAGLMHEAGVLSVRKAYGDKEDKGELARAFCNGLTVNNRIEFARFLRKWGLDVAIDGKTVTVGGIRDPRNQARHVKACADDIAFWKLVDAHVKPKAEPKVPTGTVAEQADAAIAALVARMKTAKNNPLGPEVAGLINQRLSQKVVEVEVTQVSTFVTKDGHVYELDAAEEAAMLDWLLARESAKATLKVVNA